MHEAFDIWSVLLTLAMVASIFWAFTTRGRAAIAKAPILVFGTSLVCFIAADTTKIDVQYGYSAVLNLWALAIGLFFGALSFYYVLRRNRDQLPQ